MLGAQKAYGRYLPIRDGEFFIFKDYEINPEENLIIVEGLYKKKRQKANEWKEAFLYFQYPDNWDGDVDSLDLIEIKLKEDE